MFKLIDFIIFGCWHQWKILGSSIVNENKTAIGYAYICQCTKCGEPRRFNMY